MPDDGPRTETCSMHLIRSKKIVVVNGYPHVNTEKTYANAVYVLKY
jgi:hypothetical protein